MTPFFTLVVYCLFVMGASLFGGILPTKLRLTHRSMNLVMALVAGVILGIGLFHLLPHAVATSGAIPGALDRALMWMMFGLLSMFLVTRTLHGHQHVPDPARAHEVVDAGHANHHHPDRQRHNWIGIALGMSIHSIFDGIALAASVSDEHAVKAGSLLLGLGTFVAVFMHKPLDAMSITSLIVRGGGSAGLSRIVNIGFALLVPIGAGVFSLGVTQFSHRADMIISAGLAFSAGVFTCIALGDLLPELHFHPRDRIRLSSALVVGVLLAHLMGSLEPAHLHLPHGDLHSPTTAGTSVAPDDDADHAAHDHHEH
ncbi:MAG: ZIP family metal transporter [Phycisphaerales bacterium]|nr:ZIP family metal transporter [Phycisphaerales bacterium]MCB9863865.1 ZIP family metal transporter [Phycisphaerales bacterium]